MDKNIVWLIASNENSKNSSDRDKISHFWIQNWFSEGHLWIDSEFVTLCLSDEDDGLENVMIKFES